MKPILPGIACLSGMLLGCLWTPGCRRSAPQSDAGSDRPVYVVCTTGQVADMVRHVGGQHVRVESLIGSGVDPHLYRATPGDVRKLNAADAVFYSGLHLEGRMASLLEKLADRKPVHAVTQDLRRRHRAGTPLLHEIPGSKDHYDPHIWFDVSLWAQCAPWVAEVLATLDPAHKDAYNRNAEAYRGELTELHQWCKEQISSIPRQRRVLVTAHDAFGYFGSAYGIEVHGLQGISTADEADLATANRLVDMLVNRHIKAVFTESTIPPRRIRSLVEACAARGHTVTVGKDLYSDAMGPEKKPDGQINPEGTYVGMVRYNVRTIAEALGVHPKKTVLRPVPGGYPQEIAALSTQKYWCLFSLFVFGTRIQGRGTGTSSMTPRPVASSSQAVSPPPEIGEEPRIIDQ